MCAIKYAVKVIQYLEASTRLHTEGTQTQDPREHTGVGRGKQQEIDMTSLCDSDSDSTLLSG